MPAPLCVLAADQRGWLTDALYGPGEVLTPERLGVVADIKLAIAEAAAAYDGAQGQPGLLVDERYGAAAARHARAAGLTLAMPVELDRQQVLTPEYGSDWPAHLDAFDPELAKLLIWHNPDGSRDVLDAQLARLAEIAGALRAQGRPVMLEVLSPPTAAQLDRCGGDHRRFDHDLLPGLTLRAIDEVLAADVHVDVWKLEGMPDAATFSSIRERCQQANPGARCLVLGRNAAPDQVATWLKDAAQGGFAGFAVGRTAWWEPVRDWLAGRTGRAAAVDHIAGNYASLCETFSSAAGEHQAGCPVPRPRR